jgi:hypothetical protein
MNGPFLDEAEAGIAVVMEKAFAVRVVPEDDISMIPG